MRKKNIDLKQQINYLEQERERQGDLVRDLVLSRIQRQSSPEKKERRGSFGSLTQAGLALSSSRGLRAGSEPLAQRTTHPPDSLPLASVPPPLRPVSEDTVPQLPSSPPLPITASLATTAPTTAPTTVPALGTGAFRLY